MSTLPLTRWDEANQRYLQAMLALVQDTLREQNAHLHEQETQGQPRDQLLKERDEAIAALAAPAALARLCAVLKLSSFERDLLLLCVGVELDSSFRRLCGRTIEQEPSGQSTHSSLPALPTFGLALAVLHGGHWDAIAPSSPLRRWQLITIGKGPTLVLSPLRIDETILHWLMGLPYIDERLSMLRPASRPEARLVPSHQSLVEEMLTIWARLQSFDTIMVPIIQLCGEDNTSKQAIAVHACNALNIQFSVLQAENLPGSVQEVETLARLWERQAALTRSALLLDCDELDATEPGRILAVTRFLQQVRSPVVMVSRERQHLLLRQGRPVITLEARRPVFGEQRQLWQQALGNLNG
ncbi:MAG TPA: ATP-binding protein, partial [Ktedonobacteraceae bacterium]|nr:ATP-binding protein [Ktedonobacteraceae bacterium]